MEWPLGPTEPSVGAPGMTSGVSGIATNKINLAYLGNCVLRPFRRDQKSDFANDGGVNLVAAAVIQIIGTIAETGITRGELPWDTDFGSAIALLLHRNPDTVFEELANIYVVEALQRWEPRAIVRGSSLHTKIIDGESHVFLRTVFNVAASNTPGSAIIATDLVATVPMS